MRTSIALVRTSLLLRLFALSTVVMLAVAPGLVDSVPSSSPVTARPETPAGAPADAVVGRLPWGKLSCLACAGSLLGLGYGTVVGAVAVATAWPQYAFWCGMGCASAFR